MKAELQNINPGDLTESFYLGFKVNDLQPSKISSRLSYVVNQFTKPKSQTFNLRIGATLSEFPTCALNIRPGKFLFLPPSSTNNIH
jgi:hypothetical protein